MAHRFGLVLIMFAGLASAQKMSVSPGALTNQDVVTLAGAGFSESFIIDAINTSRTQFDTSAPALAELAKHTINERIVRTMMSQNAEAPAMLAAAAEGAVQVVMPTPESPRTPVKAPRPARPHAAVLAISSGTPYYEWKSYFWGLFKKRVGVGAVTNSGGGVSQHLGPLYQQVRPAQQYVRIVAPAPGLAAPPMTYYTVAP